ncbi:PP2C family protein-serine/threonine phosphatase [Planotetraspora thailandica]|uniref:PP2C family protein-serine/threonine phosphatase n=1 Tax=Planotetraspora thailandica TaxID=487172 RepID=UPI001EF1C8E4|nr:PP2C family protein-serine/threonine phosphatase [Planotetraspora thailandica]
MPGPFDDGLLMLAQRESEMGWGHWDLTTGEASWSEHMYTIFGRDAGDGPISLLDLPAHADPDDRAPLDRALAQIVRLNGDGAEPVRAEFRIHRGDDVRDLSAVLEPAAAGVRGVIRDVTVRRRAERVLEESTRALLEVSRQAAQEQQIMAALRDAILPGHGTSITLPYASIAVRYVPAEKAASLGGDWYEATRLPGGRMFLAVGDVSGHGLPAIAEMAQLRHALVGLTMTGATPGLLLAWLNALVLNRLDDTTATVVCGYYDPPTRVFTWAQAGHLAPILVRHGQAEQLAAPHGVVLGATSGQPYSVAEIRLEPGDLLLMFTDGLIERRCRDIGEGLELTLQAAGEIWEHGEGLEGSLDRLIEEIGGPNPEDDTCLLAVSVLGS